MHLQPRKLKSKGTTVYYLRFWDNGKNKCVPRKVIEHDPLFRGVYPFETKKQGLEFIEKSTALDDYKRHSKGLSELKRKRKYKDFDDLISIFEKDLKHDSPNSYNTFLGYFDRYVLDFYLVRNKEYNINKWHQYFRDFRLYLREEAYKSRVQKGESELQLIAYSTKNHCIRALNSFLKSMRESNFLLPECYVKCPSFKRHLVDQNARTHKDIISIKEFELLKLQLEQSKEFFVCAYHTGMRFMELYSLSIDDIFFQEHVEKGIEDWMKEELYKHGLDIYGYIIIKSQAVSKVRERDINGHVDRKPLKGRKTQTLKDGRVIPITDFETMNILISRYNDVIDDYEKRKYGDDKKNYFLFNEPMNVIRRDFKVHCDKGFHSCRHSKTTMLIGLTQNIVLSRTIIGHKSIDVFDRYVHIYEEYMQKALQHSSGTIKRRGLLKIVDEEKAG